MRESTVPRQVACRLDWNTSGSGYSEMTFACPQTSNASLVVFARRKTSALRFRQNRGFAVPCLQRAAMWSEKRPLCSVRRTFVHGVPWSAIPCVRATPSFAIFLVSFAWEMRLWRGRRIDATRRSFSSAENARTRCRAARSPLARTASSSTGWTGDRAGC